MPKLCSCLEWQRSLPEAARPQFFAGESCRPELIGAMRSSALRIVAFALGLLASFFGPALTGSSAPPDAAPPNATAYRALRVARAALGAEALDRLAEMTGRDGVPQPYLWKIVLQTGTKTTGWKEIDVADGKIVAQHVLTRPPDAVGVVKLQALNVDSAGAFDAADAQSRKARVRFDAVNYALRANEAGQPVWTMELVDQNGAGVGTMRVTASDGTLASLDGRLANIPGRPGETPAVAANAVPPSTAATITTTTVNTTASTAPPVGGPPPPAVHDIDSAAPPPVPAQDSEGGFFTRAGRTLDHTQGNVVHSFDSAHDNVARSFETAHQKVDHSLRATGATLEHFFTGHSDPDRE